MKIKIFLILLPIFLFANNDFLSKDEYQLSLYQNPRGIGCDKCHGIDGSEQLFATYKNDTEVIKVIIPSIKGIDFAKLKNTLNRKTSKKNIMPNYYLTDVEIKNLYLYLNKRRKNDK